MHLLPAQPCPWLCSDCVNMMTSIPKALSRCVYERAAVAMRIPYPVRCVAAPSMHALTPDHALVFWDIRKDMRTPWAEERWRENVPGRMGMWLDPSREGYRYGMIDVTNMCLWELCGCNSGGTESWDERQRSRVAAATMRGGSFKTWASFWSPIKSSLSLRKPKLFQWIHDRKKVKDQWVF